MKTQTDQNQPKDLNHKSLTILDGNKDEIIKVKDLAKMNDTTMCFFKENSEIHGII